ncbi:leucine-rich melanocyte differentiation-associated protein [Lepeophtheirus salmonis]|uniref:leucine-rich melanocyte differentiation-associated protein n=1 Tax=Lepeophtheirus salmonis TaxID=72036 RepID=UPI001AE342B7|nr:leucine-rich melanocyte differentiation-associated protein-like isoform X1 [Lepeophtheirus salmonis]
MHLEKQLNFNEKECSITYVGDGKLDDFNLLSETSAWRLETITTLDLSNCHSKDLFYIRVFSNLQTLILNNCDIDNKVFSTLSPLPCLETLCLNKNKLFDLNLIVDSVKFLYPKIRHLSLHGNPICPDELSDNFSFSYGYERYRLFIIKKIGNLSFLDSSPVTVGEKIRASIQESYFKRYSRKYFSGYSQGNRYILDSHL